MLRLDLNSTARWLDLGHGVRLKVDPLTTTVMTASRRDPAVTAAVKLLNGPAEQDGEAQEAIATAMARAIARRVVIDWSGVGDAAGKAVKVTPEGIDALMDVWVMFQAFQANYVATGFLLESEKNVLSPLPNGTSAGVGRTAVPAKGRARSVRKS